VCECSCHVSREWLWVLLPGKGRVRVCVCRDSFVRQVKDWPDVEGMCGSNSDDTIKLLALLPLVMMTMMELA